MNRGAADPGRFGKTTNGPVLPCRQRRVGEGEDAIDVLAPGDRRNSTPAGRIAKQALRSLRPISTMPQRDGPHRDAEYSRDSAAGVTVARKQHDAGARHDTLRRRPRSNPNLEELTGLGRKAEAQNPSRFPVGHRISGRWARLRAWRPCRLRGDIVEGEVVSHKRVKPERSENWLSPG